MYEKNLIIKNNTSNSLRLNFGFIQHHKTISNLENGAGFTLIEIIVVVAIMVVITSIGFAAFSNYSRRQEIEQPARDVAQMLERAKANAASSVKPYYTSILGPQPQTCFYDFDKNGVPNLPSEGTITGPWELRGYRVLVSIPGSTYRIYVVCFDTIASANREILVEQKTLPAGLSFAAAPGLSTCGGGNFYYAVLTANFLCNGVPTAAPSGFMVLRGSQSKTITLDRYGKITIN